MKRKKKRTYFSVDLLARQIYQTGILFVSLVFGSFCSYQCVYFCKKSSFPSSLFRRKLTWIRSVSPLTSCFWKCLFCRFCTIKSSVLNVNYQKLKKIEGVFLVKLLGISSLCISDVYILVSTVILFSVTL